MEHKKKKKAGKWIAGVCVCCLVAGLAALPMLSSQQETDSEDKPVIKKAAAEPRTVSVQIIGGGQLAGEGEYNVNIPENVLLESYLVGNGDSVNKGDPIAKVDKVSVMSAITAIQATLEDLSSQINDESGTSTTGTITTNIAGRVKKIYAQVGDSVEDVILEHGALAVISLDDTMAATVTCSTKMELGDKVDVRFADGTTITGKIRSNISGEITVVMDDNKYAIGTPVTLLKQDGTRLGETELYVYNAWNLIAYSGTVSRIYVSEESTVYADQTMFGVTDLTYSAKYQQLIDQRQKYEARMYELFQMYRSGVITAPCDGIISGVDDSGAYMLADREGEHSGIQLMLLSEVVPVREIQITTEYLAGGMVGAPYTGWLTASDGTDDISTEGEWAATGLPGGLTLDSASGEISGTPKNAGTCNITVGFTYDGVTVTKELSLTIVKSAQATYYGYLAQVTDGGGNTIKVNQTANAYTISDLEVLPSASASPDDMTVKDQIYSGETIARDGYKVGDIIWIIVDENGKLVKTALVSSGSQGGGNQPGGGGSGSGGGMPGGGSMPSGGSGGFSGGGSMPSGGTGSGSMPTAGTTEEESSDGLGKVSVATVTSQEHMSITVSIDELDITKLYVGQTATITMNSLAGETAQATVKSIANSGENSGGNTKFSVEFELEKSSDMLPGMNATAYVTIDEKENALCVPAGAVYDVDGESIVYTGYDEEKGTLLNQVTVTVGYAEADYVEILSGLSEGDTVYYEYYDNLRVVISI